MRKTLAITTALLALLLAACGADGELEVQTGADGEAEDLYSTGATDTMRNDGGAPGTGVGGGASTNVTAAERGLGGVAGAVSSGWSGRAAKDVPDTAWNTDASWNPDAADVRYERMLENGRVHDRDGFLRDGENTSWRTF